LLEFASSNQVVLTVLLQQCDGGGAFECASNVRGDGSDQDFEVVEAVLDGKHPTTSSRAKAGTLNFFNGSSSLHRVTEVEGPTRRVVAVLSYDTQPGQHATREKNVEQYGPRVANIYAARDAMSQK